MDISGIIYDPVRCFYLYRGWWISKFDKVRCGSLELAYQDAVKNQVAR